MTAITGLKAMTAIMAKTVMIEALGLRFGRDTCQSLGAAFATL